MLWRLPLAEALLMVAAIRERNGAAGGTPTLAEMELGEKLKELLETANEHAT